MEKYQEDKSWSDLYHKQARAILGYHATQIADLYADRNLGRDYQISPKDVACRIRRADYAKYGHEFTIRLDRASGAKTEFEKILSGRGDWLLYGFSTSEGQLSSWVLIDLAVFREYWFNADWAKHRNNDGTEFLSFSIASFPPNLIIAKGNGLDFLN
jgi:hypothetical protein